MTIINNKMINKRHFIIFNDYRIPFKVTVTLFLLLVCSKMANSQNDNKDSYCYYIYNTQDVNSGYYYCTYSRQNNPTYDDKNVELLIYNPEGSTMDFVSVFFISNDNDTIIKASDSNGVVRISLNSLSLYSHIYVNANTAETYNHEPKRRYNVTKIDLNKYVTTDYETNTHFVLDKIIVVASGITPENAYYIIESRNPLEKNDIDCIRADILIGTKNCPLWNKVKIKAYADI